MKIGIITLPPLFNYGNILQAYALQSILEKLGHEASVVVAENRYPQLPLLKRPLVYFKRMIVKLFKNTNFLIFEERANHIMFQHTECFIQRFLKLSDYASFKKIKQSDFDAYVVGSDQIWRRAYNKNIYDKYLAFAENWNVKKIAYAASFGVDEWELTNEETGRCRTLVKKFDAVSVREISAVGLVKKYYGLNAEWVLDPTLLLSKDDYVRKLGIDKYQSSPGNLFCYLLTYNDCVDKSVQVVAEQEHLEPFHVYSCFENRFLPLNKRIQPPLEAWLRGFMDAKLVLTDSFHATVFSILFQKPFVLFTSSKRGNSRMLSLLEMAGFDISENVWGRKFIPNEKNLDALNEYREKSIVFLKKNLED